MQTETSIYSKPPAVWAVCPNIRLGGAAEKPRFFRTKFDATGWLKRPLPEPRAEDIAQQFGLRVEDIIASRNRNRARYRLCRAMFDHGKLSALAFPSEFTPRTPDNQGFQKPVPISLLAEESGPAAKSLSAFLPLSSIGRWIPKFDLNDELSRALNGTRLSPAVRCYLGRGWRFDEIEADTWKRTGHEYAGRAHKSIGEIIVKALYDLDISLGQFHPKLSTYVRADFWRSWQVDDHIARFCGMLAESEEAEALAREAIWDETDRAREWVSLQLELYAADLKATAPSVGPAPSSPGAGSGGETGANRRPEWHPEKAITGTYLHIISNFNITYNTNGSVTHGTDEHDTRTHVSGGESALPGENRQEVRPSDNGNDIGETSSPISGAAHEPMDMEPSRPGATGPNHFLDFASEVERSSAVAAYTKHWTCSEAGLARTAKVDPADLCKWKKGDLPATSDKKTRIEKALKANERPTPTARQKPGA
jgi:hypothetical protein